MSAVDIVLGAVLVGTVVVVPLAVLFAVQTILATRRMRTAEPTPKPTGPYRVAGDGTIATVKCRVAVDFDPAKLAALTPEQRERVMAAIIDEAIRNVSSGEIAAEIRQKLDAVVANAEAGAIDGDPVSSRNYAESHNSGRSTERP